MTRIEEDHMYAMIHNAKEIAKQLKLANKLKCIELKCSSSTIPCQGMIDDIEAEIDS